MRKYLLASCLSAAALWGVSYAYADDEQVTLQKSIVAANLQPGTYKIEIKVNDNISKQTVNPSALFAVE